MDKLLVVGGTGFIGDALVEEGLKQGYTVTSLSLNPPHQKRTNVSYLQMNISEMFDVNKNLKFDYVINAAGYINHSAFHTQGYETIKVHFNGTVNLINSLDINVLKRFVQIGSSDEYGDNMSPQIESMLDRPFSCYSFAKSSVTNLLKLMASSEKFPAVIIRPFLVYGPKQDLKRFLPQVITSCLNDDEFKTSQGDQLRDFCYIDDVVKGIFMALKSDKVIGEVINIGSGKPVKIKDVVSKIVTLTNGGKPLFGGVPYRVGENMELWPSVNKALELLGWEAKVSLEEGLLKTISHFKNNVNK